MFKKLLTKWNQYRYRFVPWIAFNLKDRTLRSVPEGSEDKIMSDGDVEDTLIKFFSALLSGSDRTYAANESNSRNTRYSCSMKNGHRQDLNKIDKTISRNLNFYPSVIETVSALTKLHDKYNRTDNEDIFAACKHYIAADLEHNTVCLPIIVSESLQTFTWKERLYNCKRAYSSDKKGNNNYALHTKDINNGNDNVSLTASSVKHQYGCMKTWQRNLHIMEECLGYAIKKAPSTVAGGGLGVKVIKGTIPQGSVVAMYPGCIYQPFEPILIQSIGNPFIFRCIDSILIDGNDRGISKFLYRSCAQRDRMGPYFMCDMSWLTDYPANPIAIGQYVNNQNKGNPANVCYQEFDIPINFPFHLHQYIPNIHYSSTGEHPESITRLIRTVVLVSVRDIQEGEELFSTYFTVIH